MDHLIVELKTIIVLATITFIVETNLCELQPMDEQVSNDFINNR